MGKLKVAEGAGYFSDLVPFLMVKKDIISRSQKVFIYLILQKGLERNEKDMQIKGDPYRAFFNSHGVQPLGPAGDPLEYIPETVEEMETVAQFQGRLLPVWSMGRLPELTEIKGRQPAYTYFFRPVENPIKKPVGRVLPVFKQETDGLQIKVNQEESYKSSQIKTNREETLGAKAYHEEADYFGMYIKDETYDKLTKMTSLLDEIDFKCKADEEDWY